MVAFLCPCGKSTTEVEFVMKLDETGYSRVLCSQKCFEKYKDVREMYTEHDTSEFPQPDGQGCAACNGCSVEFIERQYGKENILSKPSQHWVKIFGTPGVAYYDLNGKLIIDVATSEHCCQDAWHNVFPHPRQQQPPKEGADEG